MTLALKKTTIKYCLAGILSTFGLAGNAHAIAIGQSEATLDWSSLTVTTSNSNMIVNLDWVSDTVYAGYSGYSLNESIEDYGDGVPITPINVSISGPEAYASAAMSDSTMNAQAHAQGSGSAGSAYADSFSERYWDFLVEGDGTVTFTIDYTLSTSARTEYLFEEADGYAELYLELLKYDVNYNIADSVSDYLYSFAFAYDGNSEEDELSGKLSISMDFMDGDEGSFYAWVFADASHLSEESPVEVPEPASFWLLLSGLAGFAARKRITH